MARITTFQAQNHPNLIALIVVALLGSACGRLVTPDNEAIEPAQRTARLEELHRVVHIQKTEEQAHSIVRWVSDIVYRADSAKIEPIAHEIVRQAEIQDLDPLLVAAVVAIESYYNTDVISYAGAVGLMQVLPYVGRDVAQRNNIGWQDWQTLLQPNANVAIGTRYLRELIDMFDGDLRLALAAYNMGPTLLKQRLKRGFKPTGPYVTKVMGTYRTFVRSALHEQHVQHLTLG